VDNYKNGEQAKKVYDYNGKKKEKKKGLTSNLMRVFV
jgi:hypothetical protein